MVAVFFPSEPAVWVAEVAGKVVGYLALNECTVERLYVAPVHQGRGVGTLLLDKAKTLRPDGLRLSTLERCDRARAFYEARGFVLIAFGDGSDDRLCEPLALYEWRGEV